MDQLQPLNKKRRRTESSQSCESGVSFLSNTSLPSNEQLDIQYNDEVSETLTVSVCKTKGLNFPRTSVTNVQEQKAKGMMNAGETKRKRQVSWSCCDEEAEALVTGFETNLITQHGEQMNCNGQLTDNRNICSVNNNTRRPSCQHQKRQGTQTKILYDNYCARSGRLEKQINNENCCHHDCERKNIEIQCEHRQIAERQSCEATSPCSRYRSSPHFYESLPQLPTHNIQWQNQAQDFQVHHAEIPTSLYPRRSKSCDVLSENEITVPGSFNNNFIVNRRSSVPINRGNKYAVDLDLVYNSEKGSKNKGNTCHGICLKKQYSQRWFYALLICNIVIVVLNGVTLFDNFNVFDRAKLDTNAICMQCLDLRRIAGNGFEKYQLHVNENGQCCLSDTSLLLPFIANIANSLKAPKAQASSGTAPCYEGIPVAEYHATGKISIEHGKPERISWEINTDSPIQRGFERLDSATVKTTVTIQRSGIYFVYLRVHHKRPYSQSGQAFDVGYSIVKMTGNGADITIDSVDQNCIPGISSSSMVHQTNHLGSLYNLTKEDRIYVSLTNPELFAKENTKLGLFLVSSNI